MSAKVMKNFSAVLDTVHDRGMGNLSDKDVLKKTLRLARLERIRLTAKGDTLTPNQVRELVKILADSVVETESICQTLISTCAKCNENIFHHASRLVVLDIVGSKLSILWRVSRKDPLVLLTVLIAHEVGSADAARHGISSNTLEEVLERRGVINCDAVLRWARCQKKL